MSLNGMNELDIAMEKFDLAFRQKINKKVDVEKFREFIEAHPDIFTWNENTETGIQIIENIQLSKNKESLLKSLNKTVAFALYDTKKSYKFSVAFNETYGTISITNTRPARMTISFLEILLNLANHCHAILLQNGKKQITRDFIEKEKSMLKQTKR